MGNINSVNALNNSKCIINFENIQDFIKTNNTNIILLNTIELNKQQDVIKNTLSVDREEQIINNLLNSYNKNKIIYVYGENANDNTVITKYNQLINMGFSNVYMYIGGLFEWLLLQEIYGCDEFPTLSYVDTIDFIKYKPKKLNII